LSDAIGAEGERGGGKSWSEVESKILSEFDTAHVEEVEEGEDEVDISLTLSLTLSLARKPNP
jgi:hypothetical protein